MRQKRIYQCPIPKYFNSILHTGGKFSQIFLEGEGILSHVSVLPYPLVFFLFAMKISFIFRFSCLRQFQTGIFFYLKCYYSVNTGTFHNFFPNTIRVNAL